jgi:hypothetical protein
MATTIRSPVSHDVDTRSSLRYERSASSTRSATHSRARWRSAVRFAGR